MLNKRSSIAGKMPKATELEYGELAINYSEGKEFLSVLNSASAVTTFDNTTTYPNKNDGSLNYDALSLKGASEDQTSYVDGEHSATLGHELQASNQGEVAVGKFNETGNRLLFSVGNGSDAEHRSNALSVDESGKTSVDSLYINNGEDVTLVIDGDEINLSDYINSIQMEVDNEFSSASTNPVQNKVITDYIVETELTVSSALNDLNARILDNRGMIDNMYTKGEVDSLIDSIDVNVDVDDALSSASTNPVQNKVITAKIDELAQTIEDNELTTAGALNYLNERIGDMYTKDEVDSLIDGIEVDSELSSASTNPVQNKVISQALDDIVNEILDDEYVVAKSLTDLDDRVSENTSRLSNTYTKDEVDGMIDNIEVDDSLSEFSENPVQNKVIKQALDNIIAGQITVDDTLLSSSTNPVQNAVITQAINNIIAGQIYVDDELSSSSTNPVQNKVITSALTDKADLSGLTTHTSNSNIHVTESDKENWNSKADSDDLYSLSGQIVSDELVISSALNDLNSRIIEDNATITILGGDLQAHTSDTSVHVTAEDKNTWNSKIGPTDYASSTNAGVVKVGSGLTIDSNGVLIATGGGGGTPIPADSATSETSTNAIQNQAITKALMAHSGDTDMHVTANEKTTWSNKQNKLSNESVLSGITSGKVSSWDSAASASHTHNNKSVLDNLTQPVIDNSHSHTNKDVLDGITSEKVAKWDAAAGESGHSHWNLDVLNTISASSVSNWNTVTAKTDNTAFTAHTGNTNMHVTASDKATWNTVTGKTDNTAFTAHTGNSDIHVTTAQTQSWDSAVSASHSHTNKSVLDGITTAKTQSWDDKVGKTDYAGPLVAGVVKIGSGLTIDSDGVLIATGGGGGTPIPADSATSETSMNAVQNQAITKALMAHSGDTNIHVTAIEKAAWSNKQNKLSNESVLSGITSGQVSSWDSAASASHSHGNKAVLDNLTQTVIDNSHTHGNKSVLDGITTAKTQSWDTVTAKTDNTTFTAHTSNTTAHVTTAQTQSWDSAVSASHSHTNKTVLDGITTAKTQSWDTVTAKADNTAFTAHSATTIPSAVSAQMHLPTVTAADNGKILMVVNGAWALVSPTTIYTGSGTPDSSQGNDGDIYLQTS